MQILEGAIERRSDSVYSFLENLEKIVLSSMVEAPKPTRSHLYSLIRLRVSRQERESFDFRFQDAVTLAFVAENEMEAAMAVRKGDYAVTLYPVTAIRIGDYYDPSSWIGERISGTDWTIQGNQIIQSVLPLDRGTWIEDGTHLHDKVDLARGDWLIETKLAAVFFLEKNGKSCDLIKGRTARKRLTKEAVQLYADRESLGLLCEEATKILEFTVLNMLQTQLSLKSKLKSLKQLSVIPFDVLVNCWYLSRMRNAPNAQLAKALKELFARLENWQPAAFKIFDKALSAIS